MIIRIYDGLLSKKNGKHFIKQEKGEIIEINDENVLEVVGYI